MTPEMFKSFGEELGSITKQASKADAFLAVGEILGLSLLAKPSMDILKNPKAKKIDKKHAKWEVAGLGTLAAATLGYEGIKLLPKMPKVKF